MADKNTGGKRVRAVYNRSISLAAYSPIKNARALKNGRAIKDRGQVAKTRCEIGIERAVTGNRFMWIEVGRI